MSGYTVKPPTGDTNEQTQFIDYFNLFYSKRGQEQISISQQLGNYGTTFFSASRQSYWNTSRSDQQISFGLNVPFGDITTSLNYSYSNNIWQNDRDHLLAFTLNVPFSHWMRTDSQSAFRNSNASYSMSNDLKGGMTNLSGVYGTLLPDNNLNYITPTEVIHRLAPVVTVLLIIVELMVILMSVTVGVVTAARFITE